MTFSFIINRTTLPPETLTWDPLEIHSMFTTQNQTFWHKKPAVMPLWTVLNCVHTAHFYISDINILSFLCQCQAHGFWLFKSHRKGEFWKGKWLSEYGTALLLFICPTQSENPQEYKWNVSDFQMQFALMPTDFLLG